MVGNGVDDLGPGANDGADGVGVAANVDGVAHGGFEVVGLEEDGEGSGHGALAGDVHVVGFMQLFGGEAV